MLEIKELRADALFLIVDFFNELNIVDDVYRIFFVENKIDFEFKNPNKPTKKEQAEFEELKRKRGHKTINDLIKLVIKNFSKSKSAVYELLGEVTGTDAKTIQNTSMPTLVRLITDLFKKKELMSSLKPLLELFANEPDEDETSITE